MQGLKKKYYMVINKNLFYYFIAIFANLVDRVDLVIHLRGWNRNKLNDRHNSIRTNLAGLKNKQSNIKCCKSNRERFVNIPPGPVDI